MVWRNVNAARVLNSMFQPNATCDVCDVMIDLIDGVGLDENNKASGVDGHKHRSGLGPTWSNKRGNS